MGAAPPAPHFNARFEDLLGVLFPGDQLRGFTRRLSPSLADELPSPPAPVSHLRADAAARLVGHGFVRDYSFWATLVARSPARADEIRAVRDLAFATHGIDPGLLLAYLASRWPPAVAAAAVGVATQDPLPAALDGPAGLHALLVRLAERPDPEVLDRLQRALIVHLEPGVVTPILDALRDGQLPFGLERAWIAVDRLDGVVSICTGMQRGRPAPQRVHASLSIDIDEHLALDVSFALHDNSLELCIRGGSASEWWDLGVRVWTRFRSVARRLRPLYTDHRGADELQLLVLERIPLPE